MFKSSFKVKDPNKVRVVIVTDSLQPWNFGGKEERLRHLSDSSLKVEESNFEIFYATMKWWTGNPPANHVAISKLFPMYYKERRSIKQAIFFSISCFKVIRMRPDIIEADQVPILPIFILKLVAILCRASLSVTWHEVWGRQEWLEYLGRSGLIASQLESWAVKLPNQLIAVSIPTRFKMIQAGVPEDKIELIEPDIDHQSITRATTRLPSTDLLFAGRLIKHKNLDLVIRSVSLLKSESMLVTLSIVGDGPELSNLKRLTRELGIENQVIFHGFLPNNSDVWGLMKKCSIFVSPSTREGFGFSVLEAHYAGAKIIIADHPNNASSFYLNDSEDVISVQESTPEAYSYAIKGLLPSVRASTQISENQVLNMYEKYEKSWAKNLRMTRGAS